MTHSNSQSVDVRVIHANESYQLVTYFTTSVDLWINIRSFEVKISRSSFDQLKKISFTIH